MANEFKRPKKAFALFVYDSSHEEEKDAKQVVLNTTTKEFNEVSSTNATMIRLRIENRDAMERLVSAMIGVYKDPYRLVIKEIVSEADDTTPESGPIVYLPGDRPGAVHIMSILNHAIREYKKSNEAEIHQLKIRYIEANRNTTNINRALTDALRVVRHG